MCEPTFLQSEASGSYESTVWPEGEERGRQLRTALLEAMEENHLLRDRVVELEALASEAVCCVELTLDKNWGGKSRESVVSRESVRRRRSSF